MEEKGTQKSNLDSNWVPSTPVKRTPVRRRTAGSETKSSSRLKVKKVKPKVVREEKPKRTPKKERVKQTPPLATPLEGTKGRYNTRRKPSISVSIEATKFHCLAPNVADNTSYRGSLDFDSDAQACNDHASIQTQSAAADPLSEHPVRETLMVANSTEPLVLDFNQPLCHELDEQPSPAVNSFSPATARHSKSSSRLKTKKVRPKVVREEKPKSTPKKERVKHTPPLATPVERTRRRYNMRRKPTIPGSTEATDAPGTASCKRSLNFYSDAQTCNEHVSVQPQSGISKSMLQHPVNRDALMVANSNEPLMFDFKRAYRLALEAQPASAVNSSSLAKRTRARRLAMQSTAGSDGSVERTKHGYNTRSKPPISVPTVVEIDYLAPNAAGITSCGWSLNFDSDAQECSGHTSGQTQPGIADPLTQHLMNRETLMIENSSKPLLFDLNQALCQALDSQPTPAETPARRLMTGSVKKSLSCLKAKKVRTKMVKEEKPKRTPKKERVKQTLPLATPMEGSRCRYNTRSKPLIAGSTKATEVHCLALNAATVASCRRTLNFDSDVKACKVDECVQPQSPIVDPTLQHTVNGETLMVANEEGKYDEISTTMLTKHVPAGPMSVSNADQENNNIMSSALEIRTQLPAPWVVNVETNLKGSLPDGNLQMILSRDSVEAHGKSFVELLLMHNQGDNYKYVSKGKYERHLLKECFVNKTELMPKELKVYEFSTTVALVGCSNANTSNLVMPAHNVPLALASRCGSALQNQNSVEPSQCLVEELLPERPQQYNDRKYSYSLENGLDTKDDFFVNFKGKRKRTPKKVRNHVEATITACPLSISTDAEKNKAILVPALVIQSHAPNSWVFNAETGLHGSSQYPQMNQKQPMDSAESHLSAKYGGSFMEQLEEVMRQNQVDDYKYKQHYVSKRKQERHLFQEILQNQKMQMPKELQAYEFSTTFVQDGFSGSSRFIMPSQIEALASRELSLVENHQQHDDTKCCCFGGNGFCNKCLIKCKDLLTSFKRKKKRIQRKTIRDIPRRNALFSVIDRSSMPQGCTLESNDSPQTCEESLLTDRLSRKLTKKRSRKVTSHAMESMSSTTLIAQEICMQAAMPNYQKKVPIKTNSSKILISYSVDEICKSLMCLSISSEDMCDAAKVHNAIVPYIGQGEIVPYAETSQPLKKQRLRAKVALDEETHRVWHLLMGSETTNGVGAEKEKYWEEERRLFRGRVDSFLAKMHLIQGNRRFSKWKGSVVDSVVGVFLTPNVSDNLSSSAFMSLAASFHPKEKKECANPKKQESMASTMDETFLARDLYDTITNDILQISLAEETSSVATSSSVKFLEEANANGLSGPKCMVENASFNPFEIRLDSLENTVSVDNQESFESILEFSLSHKNGINEKKSSKKPVKSDKGKGEQVSSKEKWDPLRKQVLKEFGVQERSEDRNDAVDWEAVRRANIDLVAQTIKERGMNNIVAGRIKGFLDRMVKDHDNIDLEWLRHVPPEKAKDFLLSVNGLGLKSVECVRLLTLQQLAFPVDTNVGRICVRLGWVPLQPLPESLQLHLLELYPMLNTIQKYLWPRLCKLDQQTLYELHYQLITFGKVFCTKRRPNCNACPMRGECRHFASAFSSARLSLPASEEITSLNSKASILVEQEGEVDTRLLPPPVLMSRSVDNPLAERHNTTNICEPIIEEPRTPEPTYVESLESDIEDFGYEDPDEIPTIKLNFDELTLHIRRCVQAMEFQDSDMSKALVALTPEAASIPVRKSKTVSRLRTEHLAYILPDDHVLLKGLDKREQGDPCPYLLVIWSPGETAESIELPKTCCNFQSSGNLCNDQTCFSCNANREMNSEIVRGTLLIPCRTAMRGSFPLNGTYFQVNEVFADHESSIHPTNVLRELIWNLPRRVVYFGTSATTIFRGLTTEEIQYCFWKGFVCVRGFDRKTRAPRPLTARQHFPASKQSPNKKARAEGLEQVAAKNQMRH